MTIFETKIERSFIDTFAWLPIRAFDEYSERYAIVWLRGIRRFKNGKITFSSFWI